MPRRSVVAISLLIGLACVRDSRPPSPHPQPQPPVAVNGPFGAIDAEFDVDRQGAAVYRIPLTVAPGTNEAEPDLELLYNSQVMNGEIGIGFSLSGLSTITRIPATIAQDGFKGGVFYDQRDRFALDGFRLVEVSGAYGAPGTVYHTEKESWTRVESAGQCGSGPCSFRATTADGTTIDFGTTADSRILRTGGADVRVWAAARITDTNGNSITCTYSTREGEFYPETILYTENLEHQLESQRAVVFRWETRPDVQERWIGGSIVRTDRRLTGVTSCVSPQPVKDCSGSTTVADYTLEYDLSPSTGRSRLRRLQACGGDGDQRVCNEPTTFSWQDESKSFRPSGPDLPGPLYLVAGDETYVNAILEDINGDGVADYSFATSFPQKGSNDLRIFWGRPDGSFVDSGVLLPGPIYTTTTTGTFRTGLLDDFNGDGLPDFSAATLNQNTGQTNYDVWINSGSGFTKSFQLPGPVFWIVGQRVFTTGILHDLDGDGIPDYSRATVIQGTGEKLLDIWRGRGNGFIHTDAKLPGPVYSLTPAGVDPAGVLQDINGDGVPDYSAASVNEGTGKTDLGVHVGITPDFRYEKKFDLPGPIYWTVGANTFTTGILNDINGDAIADYSRATFLESHDQKLYDVFFGTGTGYRPAGFRLPGPIYIIGGNGWRREGELIDRNGDGAAEYSRATENIATGHKDLKIWQWTPSGFVEAGFDLPGALFTVGPFGSYIDGIYTDVNGDNVADYTESRCTVAADGSLRDCLKRVRLASGPYPDLIATITNGLRGVDKLRYDPLTLPGVYARGAMSAVGRTIQYPMYVVSSRVIETAANSADPGYARYAWRYTYEGGRVSDIGRGFLGFEKVREIDEQLGTTTTTTYNQEFPLDLTVRAQSVVRTSDNVPLGETFSDHKYSNPRPKVYLVHLTEERQVRRAGNGASYTSSTRYDYDAYGNVVLTRERRNAGSADDELFTCHRFFNSETPWRIGFLVERTQAAAATFDANSGRCTASSILTSERSELEPVTMNRTRWERWDDTPREGHPNGVWTGVRFGYDAFGNIVTLTDSIGTVTTFEIDPVYRSFATRVTVPIGSITRTFDPRFGVETGLVDLNGNAFSDSYDGLGRPTSSSGPSPQGAQVELERFIYGYEGPSPYVDELLRVDWQGSTWWRTRRYHDGLDRNYRVRADGPDGKQIVTESRFDTPTRVSFQSLPAFQGDSAAGTTIRFDDYGRVRRIELPNGSVSTVETSIDILAGISLFKVVRTDATGTPEERTITTWVDDHDNILRRQFPRGSLDPDAVADYDIDPLGRVRRTVSPAGQSETKWDSLNREREITSSARGTTRYHYDPEGRLTSRVNANGESVSFTYDEMLRMRTETLSDGQLTTYTYDETSHRNGIGELTTVTATRRGAHVYRYEHAYDPYQRITTATRTMGGRTFAFQLGYDAAGNQDAFDYPDGTRSRTSYTINGLLTATEICDAPPCGANDWKNVFRYGQYTASSRPRILEMRNGAVSRWSYDSSGALTAASTTSGSSSLLDYTYEWNKLQYLTAAQNVLDPSLTERYAYTAQGYLREATGPYGTIRYKWDAGGNRTTKEENGETTSYEYDALGRLKRATRGGEQIYAGDYDATGNIARQTTSRTLRFRFDAHDELLEVCADDCGVPGNTIDTYDYDYLGRRIRKTDRQGNVTWYPDPRYEFVEFANGRKQQTRYIAGESENVVSLTEADPNLESRVRAAAAEMSKAIYDRTTLAGVAAGVVHGFLSPFARYDVGTRISDLLSILSCLVLVVLLGVRSKRERSEWAEQHRRYAAAWPILMMALLLAPGFAFSSPYAHEHLSELAAFVGNGYPQPGQDLYFVDNQIDSVTLVLDGAGEVQARVFYKPFGELLEAASSGEDTFRAKFISRELDLDTGLYDVGSRYYNPAIGRFVSADVNDVGGPEINAAALNRYVYGLNSPATLVDSSGDAAQVVVILVAAIIGAVIGAYIGAATVNESLNPLEWDWGSSKTYLGIAAGAAIGAVGGALTGGGAAIGGVAANVIAGIAAGAFENAAFSALAGESPEEILQSAATGALVGAVFGGLSGASSLGRSGARAGARSASRASGELRGARGASREAGEELAETTTRAEARATRSLGSEGCLCFTAGTSVATPRGEVPIERVEVGDQVWSYSEATGQKELNRVTEVFEREASELVRFSAGPAVVEVTPEHLLWIETKGWRRADEIEEGDLLRTLDGSTVQIDAINDVRGHFTVYNFEVENAHTYFVSESGLLVHNPKPPCPARFKRGSFRKKTLETEWKSAPPGNGPNSRTCPTCGKIIKKRVKRFYKGKNRYMKGYDSDHIGATWAERRKEMIRREKLLSLKYSRKEILDIYNDSTRAQCASCNRSHHFEPKQKETKKYLKKMLFPTH